MDGGSSGCGRVLSGLTLFEEVVDGFVVSGGSSGSLSSIGRDQGSIFSDKERESKFLGRSGLEEEEAMSGLESAAGVETGSLQSSWHTIDALLNCLHLPGNPLHRSLFTALRREYRAVVYRSCRAIQTDSREP